MTAMITDPASAAAERKVVRDLLRRAQRRSRGVVLVDGEPGIGKSRLLRACIDEAAEHGFSLAAGAAGQRGEAIPFFALRAALGEPFAGLAAADPGRDRPDATAWRISQMQVQIAEASDGPAAGLTNRWRGELQEPENER
jgi:predicted ATPase